MLSKRTKTTIVIIMVFISFLLTGCQFKDSEALSVNIKNKNIIPLKENHYLIQIMNQGQANWFVLNTDTGSCNMLSLAEGFFTWMLFMKDGCIPLQ